MRNWLTRAAELAGKFAEELSFVQAVFERFASIDEDDGDFVGELAAELFVGIHIDFLPAEHATSLKLDQALFDNLAQMAAFSGVDQYLAGVSHGRSVAFSRQNSIRRM